MFKILSGTFAEGHGLTVYDEETDQYFHKVVLMDKDGSLFFYHNDEKYRLLEGFPQMAEKGKRKPEEFTEKEIELAKQLTYKNWKKAKIGFLYEGVWITNPFMEETGRFEFVDFAAMCKHYGEENVCDFISKILETGGAQA